jgi:Bacteriophage probable baseplate hub protein
MMATTPATGLKIARPTIHVAGQDQPVLAAGLLSLLVVENTNGLYRCEALFGNWGNVNNKPGFLYFDRRTLDFGKPFTIKLESGATLFAGKIMALEARFPDGQAPQLNVLAEDRLQDLRMTRRTRTFEEVSDSDVMNRIAGEHGLSPNLKVTGPTYKVLAQVNQSDLAFLRARARAIDAELWVEDSTLNATSRRNRISGTVELTYGNRLREFSAAADLANQRTSLTVSGWDVGSKSAIKHEADDSILSGELNGDASGASILASAFGQRKEELAHTVPLSSPEAQAAAEAFFKMSARRFLVGRGVAETDTELRVGRYVVLKEIGPLFSGKYYVSEVRHIFDSVKGIRTEFTVERPGLGRP